MAAVPDTAACGAADMRGHRSLRDSDSEGRPLMRLNIVRGSFFTAQDEDCPMDESVWSKMPEALIWEVLAFLPAAKHFQLQLVSPKWRQVLTSANFRKRVIEASALGGSVEQQPPHAVACIHSRHGGFVDSSSTSEERKMRVLEIGLGFVPRSFWANPGSAAASYSLYLVGVGDGLVCMANDAHCVLNPLTRTFLVLPPPPYAPRGWLPLTATTVTMYGGKHVFRVATYDLTNTTGGGKWLSAGYYGPVDGTELPWAMDRTPVLAMCGGELYWFQHGSLRVLAPSGPGVGALLVDAAAAVPLDGPAMALLGPDMDALAITDPYLNYGVHLVAQRGAVYLLAQVQVKFIGTRFPVLRFYHDGLEVVCGSFPKHIFDVVCDVWRLARDRMAWEPVARLHMTEVERITGLKCRENEAEVSYIDIFHACGVRELLCCQARVRSCGDGNEKSLLLGLNLDNGEWEVVHEPEKIVDPLGGDYPCTTTKPLELRPDLFLSGTEDHTD